MHPMEIRFHSYICIDTDVTIKQNFYNVWRQGISHPSFNGVIHYEPNCNGSWRDKEQYEKDRSVRTDLVKALLQHHLSTDNAAPLKVDLTRISWAQVTSPSPGAHPGSTSDGHSVPSPEDHRTLTPGDHPASSPDDNGPDDLATTQPTLQEMVTCFKPDGIPPLKSSYRIENALVTDDSMVLPARDASLPPDKIIVYLGWPHLYNLWRHLLIVHDIKFLEIHGAMSAKKKDKALQSFKEGGRDDPRVLLMSKVGLFGHNIACANILIVAVRLHLSSYQSIHADSSLHVGLSLVSFRRPAAYRACMAFSPAQKSHSLPPHRHRNHR